MLRRTLIVIFLAVLAIPVVASPCWACSCATTGDRDRDRHAHADGADLVFTGIAETTRIDDPSPNDGVSGDERIYTRFRVRKIYKGHPGRWVTIYTGTKGNSCRYTFKEGERYTVFAYEHKDEWNTNICSGTKRGGINPDNYGLPPGRRP